MKNDLVTVELGRKGRSQNGGPSVRRQNWNNEFLLKERCGIRRFNVRRNMNNGHQAGLQHHTGCHV